MLRLGRISSCCVHPFFYKSNKHISVNSAILDIIQIHEIKLRLSDPA